MFGVNIPPSGVLLRACITDRAILLLSYPDRMVLQGLTLVDLEAIDFTSVLKRYLGEPSTNPSHKQAAGKEISYFDAMNNSNT